MRRLGMLLFVVFVLGSALPYNVDAVDAPNATGSSTSHPVLWDRVNIDSVGNIRSVLGSQGKSIAVSGGGEAIAVFYGAVSGNVNNPMLAMVAYSLNGGTSWTTYGPFSGNARRLYNDVAGTPNFHANPGELWFLFQTTTQGYNDCQMQVMIEENLPSAPSFSVPIIPTGAAAPITYPWEPTMVVLPDNPTTIVVSGWSYLTGGNNWQYVWISSDGGYTWSDTIPAFFSNPDGSCLTMSAGPGGYLFGTFQDYYTFSGTDSTIYPYFIESTDGGQNWSTPVPITAFPANTSSQYWWHETDALYIDGHPWVIHNDIGVGGVGGPHVAKASGSPGSWTWQIWDGGTISYDSTWVADTLFLCYQSQYPSLSYDPTSGMVMASAKSYCYIGDNATWATLNGAHVQGIWTVDGGSTWHISQALSTANDGTSIIWDDWNATETADHMPNFGGKAHSYSVWVHEDPATEAGILYFETAAEGIGLWPHSVEESNGNLVSVYHFSVTPTVTANACRAAFTMPATGNVSLKVYDVSGRVVENVFSGQASGAQEFTINTSHLSNGAYFVVLGTDAGNVSQKIVTTH